MNEKTGKTARRLATIGLPLTLMLALMLVWGVMAEDATPGADGALVQYEITLAGAGVDRLEVLLPSGFEYVGLAPGSQVAAEPEISEDGGRLVWQGPFPGAEVLRFWLAPVRPAAAPDSLAVVGADMEAVRVEPVAASPAKSRGVAPSSVLAATVAVTKTVEPELLDPGDSRWVTYEVVFTSGTTETVVLERITETLPLDFFFGGMAFGSDVITPPVELGNSQYLWENVSFTDTLTMRYNVRAVDHAGEYQNSVEAWVGGERIGPASATLEIGGTLVWFPLVFRGDHPPGPVWHLSKTADPTEVTSGDLVDYTVVIENNGDRDGTFVTLADTLPEGFEFEAMLPGSGVPDPPTGTTGRVTWDGYWTMSPGEDLTVLYQVKSGGGGDKVNTFGIYSLGGTELGSASSTVFVVEGLPFEDDFSAGLSADWEPFTNWPGLSANRWYWAGVKGSWGIYNYEWDRVLPGWTGYDLSIYNDPGARNWTDYRIEARVKDAKESGSMKSGLTGIWFRGTYEDSGLNDGKKVGGYYVYLKASNDTLYLMRTPPGNPTFGSHTVQKTYYYAPRIGLKHWYKLIVEVEGYHIKVWFEDDEDGVSNPVLAFEWTDSLKAWGQGTVGFATYYTTGRFDYIRVEPLE